MFENNIADLVEDTDLTQRVFLAIKGNPSPVLSRVLSSLSIFEDQVLKVKKAQRNLSDHETLLAKRNSNMQEAKELTQLIDDLKNSSFRIDLELTQLEIRRVELEKELEKVKATIDRLKSNLAQIPDAIKQKKQELLAKVREGRVIRSSLEGIPGSTEEDKQQIAEVDAIRLEVLKAILDVLDL